MRKKPFTMRRRHFSMFCFKFKRFCFRAMPLRAVKTAAVKKKKAPRKTPNKAPESAGKTKNEKQANEFAIATVEEVKSMAAPEKRDSEHGKINLNEVSNGSAFKKGMVSRSEDGILLPGLPNEISTLCIGRVPHIYHSSLRSVNFQWRKLVDSPSFISLRKELGYANTSLFLVPKFFNNQEDEEEEENRLNCWQVDLDLESHHSSKPRHIIPSNNENIILEDHNRLRSDCVAVGRLVMLIGGLIHKDRDLSVVSDVYIFNTVTREWRKGPNMHNSRFNFAYGVIEGRLYVAGGYVITEAGDPTFIKEVEVFDPQTHIWTRIASLPVSLYALQYFVMDGSLFLIGDPLPPQTALQAFSYKPLEDQWQPQQWLVNIDRTKFIDPSPEHTCEFMTVNAKDNSMYYLEVCSPDFRIHPCSRYLHTFRNDRNSFRWEHESVVSIRDLCSRSHRCCSGFQDKFLRLKDKVLIIDHLKDAENAYDVRIRNEGNVVIVAVKFPDRWYAAVVNA